MRFQRSLNKPSLLKSYIRTTSNIVLNTCSGKLYVNLCVEILFGWNSLYILYLSTLTISHCAYMDVQEYKDTCVYKVLNVLTCKNTKFFSFYVSKFNSMLTQSNDLYKLGGCQYMSHTLEIVVNCRRGFCGLHVEKFYPEGLFDRLSAWGFICIIR